MSSSYTEFNLAALDGVRIGPVNGEWDAIGNWLLSRSALKLPGITPATERLCDEDREGAERLIADAVRVDDWTPIELGRAEENGLTVEGDIARRLYPLGERFGAAAILVAAAEHVHSLGGWHWSYAPPSWPREKEAALLAKLNDGEVVAILAPARRSVLAP